MTDVDPSACVLAIDQGTSGTKAIVWSAEHGIVASHEVVVRPAYGADGTVEVDPKALLASVIEAGRMAVDRAREAGHPAIAAVGLANQGETVLRWDRASGEPLSVAIGWQDRRAQVVCDDIRSRDSAAAQRVLDVSGLTLDPYFGAPKLAWLRQHFGPPTGSDDVVTQSDAFLIHALTGAFATDASTASRTALLDLDSRQWSPELLDVFRLDGESLPAIIDSAGFIGETSVFGPTIPMTAAIVDQPAALLAQHCLAVGQAKCTYGTGAFLLSQIGPTPVRSAAGLTTSVAWTLGSDVGYCLDGQAFTVGSAVRWMIDIGLLSAADEIDSVLADVPDAAVAVFVPAMAGLGGPWWEPEARGSITGIGLGTGKAHLVRALIDGIACAVAELADAASAAHPLTALRVDGGLTRSRALLQAQADLLQCPVEVRDGQDATALGTAYLTVAGLARADGAAADGLLQRVLPEWSADEVIEPRMSADQAAQQRAQFRAAVEAGLR